MALTSCARVSFIYDDLSIERQRVLTTAESKVYLFQKFKRSNAEISGNLGTAMVANGHRPGAIQRQKMGTSLEPPKTEGRDWESQWSQKGTGLEQPKNKIAVSVTALIDVRTWELE